MTLSDEHVTIGIMIENFANKYGNTNPDSRQELQDSLIAQWDPADGFDDLQSRMATIEMVYLLISIPLSNTYLVENGNLVIASTSMYNNEYKVWCRREKE